MRPHHYQFAHHALPAHFFTDVTQFTKMLQMDGKVFLHYLWTATGEDLDEDPLPYSLELERRKHGKYTIYLITMPEPTAATEAFYILLASDGRKHFYFTLEAGQDLKDESKFLPIHCEWTADGTHKNFGQLGSTDIETFAKECCKSLK